MGGCGSCELHGQAAASGGTSRLSAASTTPDAAATATPTPTAAAAGPRGSLCLRRQSIGLSGEAALPNPIASPGSYAWYQFLDRCMPKQTLANLSAKDNSLACSCCLHILLFHLLEVLPIDYHESIILQFGRVCASLVRHQEDLKELVSTGITVHHKVLVLDSFGLLLRHIELLVANGVQVLVLVPKEGEDEEEQRG